MHTIFPIYPRYTSRAYSMSVYQPAYKTKIGVASPHHPAHCPQLCFLLSWDVRRQRTSLRLGVCPAENLPPLQLGSEITLLRFFCVLCHFHFHVLAERKPTGLEISVLSHESFKEGVCAMAVREIGGRNTYIF